MMGLPTSSLAKRFPSPCGDKLKFKYLPEGLCMVVFSPPYGDGTAKSANITNPMEFSSPCGDKLQYYQQNRRAKTMSYRPLAGMVCIKCSMTLASCGFRPLTGMVPRSASWTLRRAGFRPLTGIVLSIFRTAPTTTRFRPLTGMVH